MKSENFQPSFEYKLIYIFRINDKNHIGYLKIGDATIHSSKSFDQLTPNSHDLNYTAKKRIDEYTATAGIIYELLYTEIAVYRNNDSNSKKFNKILAFRDHDVHSVLKRSGIVNKHFDTNKTQNEWFKCDLETAKLAIKAVKEGKSALDNSSISFDKNPIIFRPEQMEAIDKTLKQFKKGDRMLWNAKMRFGKTLTALEVAKRSSFCRTIIITHRPVVSDGWYEDFSKIFYDTDKYEFGSKVYGKSINELINSGKNFVYFASMQDLRGSEQVGGNFDKNNIIFKLNWDFVVVDEAHEGTKTKLGQSVLQAVIKPEDKEHVTKTLELSGTPFNLLVDYEDNEIYTWDYIMEQEAKQEWALHHFGDSNPYEELPKMNIYTYHLEETFKNYMDLEDKAFNFREFFRTWTGDINKDYEKMPDGVLIGNFVHENDIRNFLKLICFKSEKNNYPFSTEEYRSYFRHTLWMLPGVKEAKAFSKLLKADPIFSQFEIINVAGDGDEEIDSNNALDAVRKAMGENPDETYTITLSCGRLTTGVSVPEWTAVMMLAGSYSTQASQYLQTIFRVQTPANINGKIKENCYVFDFAPDRTLKMVAESVQLSQRGMGSQSAEFRLQKFLNFCPVLSITETGMKEYKVSYLLQELKKAYAERVVRNGFDDAKLYNDELLKLNDIDLKEFERLKGILGSTPNQEKTKQIDINSEGFTEEEYEKIKKIEKKPKKELSEKEKQQLDELKRKRKERDSAISILRGISIRIPLLVYGADVPINKNITIEEFPSFVDDTSWKEFMPNGVTKEDFKKFSKYYDKDIFVASTFRIRFIAKSADELEPTERVQKISQLFSTFKNPDKETVLTPWRVVNMHLSETIGGYCFWNEDFSNVIDNPREVVNKSITKSVFSKEGKVLEINSKTGLYPLYVTYSFYREFCKEIGERELTFEKKKSIWNKVLENNVYIICKTPMAKQITRRTLLGYTNGVINAHAFDDLITQMKDKQNQLIKKIKTPSFWNKGENEMKFNAVVGNPPYQGTNHQQIYPNFYLSSIKIGEVVSLIFPISWQEPKNANNLARLNNPEIKSDKQIIFIDNRQNVFPGISGAEWVNIILWKKGYNNNLDGSQSILTNGSNRQVIKLLCEKEKLKKPKEIIELAKIVMKKKPFVSIMKITSVRKPYGLSTDVIRIDDEKIYKKYNISKIYKDKQKEDDIKIYAKSGLLLYVPKNYSFPKVSPALFKFKVFIPYAWGNMSEKSGLGGAFSDIIIASPGEACTETYLESGVFDSFETAQKHAKYLMTKFCRALLYINKFSQHSTSSWAAIPIQDYYEEWWNETIEKIDEHLFDKYCIPEEVRKFVINNLQTKNESNIVNFNEIYD